MKDLTIDKVIANIDISDIEQLRQKAEINEDREYNFSVMTYQSIMTLLGFDMDKPKIEFHEELTDLIEKYGVEKRMAGIEYGKADVYKKIINTYKLILPNQLEKISSILEKEKLDYVNEDAEFNDQSANMKFQNILGYLEGVGLNQNQLNELSSKISDFGASKARQSRALVVAEFKDQKK